MLKKIIELHKFFVRVSKNYMEGRKFRYIYYYPIAYIKFMYYGIQDSKKLTIYR